MILYKSKFLEVNLLEIQYTMHFLWSEYARHMDAEGVYHETLNFSKHRVRRRADQIYMDWRNIEHLVSRETFDWYVQYILPHLFSSHSHKLALLFNTLPTWKVPEKITVNNRDIQVRAFTDPSALMQWLMEGARRKDKE